MPSLVLPKKLDFRRTRIAPAAWVNQRNLSQSSTTIMSVPGLIQTRWGTVSSNCFLILWTVRMQKRPAVLQKSKSWLCQPNIQNCSATKIQYVSLTLKKACLCWTQRNVQRELILFGTLGDNEVHKNALGPSRIQM